MTERKHLSAGFQQKITGRRKSEHSFKKKSSRWYKKIFSIVYQKRRDDFPKTSKWFTEDVEMIFFTCVKPVFFLAENRLKDASFQLSAFIHKHLQAT
jgi:hypothetical protein